MNKKLLIPLFATVVGLSVVGGISGAVAWYQFNTRVNASFVGTSVADSGILQISSEKDTGYGRDVYKTNSARNNKLTPVTFGYGDTTAGKGASLPSKAYCYPEAGIEDMEKWTEARKNYEYIQFDLYLKAQKISGSSTTYSATDVYLSEMFLNSVEATAERQEVARALRVHLAVFEDLSSETPTRNFLISREGKQVNLHGNLDLDGNGQLDRKHGWAWETADIQNIEGEGSANPLIDYGKGNNSQASWAMTTSATEAELVAGQETNYILAPRYAGTETSSLQKGDLIHKLVGVNANKICTTKADGTPVKITVTVWVEGWALLKTGATEDVYEVATVASQEAFDAGVYYTEDAGVYTLAASYDDQATYYTKSETQLESAMWDPAKTGNVSAQVGMQFDVGKNAFKPAN